MGQDIRFTPDELKELATAGTLTPEVIERLHPSDRLVAVHVLSQSKGDPRGMIFDMGQAATIAPAAVPMPGTPSVVSGGGKALGALRSAVGTIAPYAGSALGAAVGSKVGHPYIGASIGAALSGGRPWGRGKASVPKTPPAPKPSTSPATFSSTGEAATAAPRMSGFSTPRQTTSTTTPSAARPPRLTEAQSSAPTPNVTKSSPTGPSGLKPPYEEVLGTTNKGRSGVETNFRGRVSFQKDTSKSAPKPTRRRTPKMEAGVKANYQKWVDEVDADYPNAPVDELLKRLEQSMRKPK